jgi:hypothetical protein
LILNGFAVDAEAAGVIEMKLAGLPIVGGLRRGPRRVVRLTLLSASGFRDGGRWLSWLRCGDGWSVAGD